ncbi:MAG: hypothetical protein JWM78_527 [Verrucomicrobiaceae bacterium]|nr:hypothetical protein [Verrucomicrobiaceae bacterium]
MSSPVANHSGAPSAAAETLQQLHDIHLPPPVGWWPPAPGWWLLLAATVAIIIAAIVWFKSYRAKHRYRRLALQKLGSIRAQWQTQHDDVWLTQALNQLLKQTALVAYPRQRVAALSGADWLLFLDSGLKQARFSEPDLRALATTYQATPQTVVPSAILNATEYWIRRHRC